MKQVKTKCPHCNKITVLEMTDEQYDDYCLGQKYIQDIFSNWSPDKREMLITGICPDCWKKIFSDDLDYEK